MKILCLIIDSDQPWTAIYAEHRRVWNAVLDRNPEVEGYFLRSDPNLATDYAVEPRRFTFKGQERYDTILTKSLKAIEVLLGDHDYVLRTNLSSLYDFPMLLRTDLPKHGLYAGSIHEAIGVTYVSGSGMILSRDVAQKLVMPTDLAVNAWDDIAIGQILASRGIAPRRIDRYDYDFGRSEDQITPGRCIQYRLRECDPRLRERDIIARVFARVYA